MLDHIKADCSCLFFFFSNSSINFQPLRESISSIGKGKENALIYTTYFIGDLTMNKDLAVFLLFLVVALNQVLCANNFMHFIAARLAPDSYSTSLARSYTSSEGSVDGGPDESHSVYARDAPPGPPPPGQIPPPGDRKGSSSGGKPSGGGKGGSGEKPTKKKNGRKHKNFPDIPDLSTTPSYGYNGYKGKSLNKKLKEMVDINSYLNAYEREKRHNYTVDSDPQAKCFDMGRKGLFYRFLIWDMSKWAFNDGGYGYQLLATIKMCNKLMGSHHEIKKTDPGNKDRSAMYFQYRTGGIVPGPGRLCVEKAMAYVFRLFVKRP